MPFHRLGLVRPYRKVLAVKIQFLIIVDMKTGHAAEQGRVLASRHIIGVARRQDLMQRGYAQNQQYNSQDLFYHRVSFHVLIRDLNDDLCKNQFDTDFKEIVMQFGKLLRIIIETIETHGLKRRNLNKHRKAVRDFFKRTLNTTYHSELATQYQKRFHKNRDKLFTFMNYDEIPWNNNNAEHAIKHFAMHRRNVDGLFSKKTIDEFLILLSIYQTCKYRGLNFMRYLLSEERSLFRYFEKHYRL